MLRSAVAYWRSLACLVPAIRPGAIVRAAASAAVAIGSLLWSSPNASAISDGGVAMPDSMEIVGQHLHLNGMGIRSFTMLHIHGYVAGLYVPAQSHDPAVLLAQPGPKVLRIEFVRTASIGRVQDEYRRMHTLNCIPSCTQVEETAFGQLLGTARDVRQGDTTTFVFLPDRVDVLFNDKKAASIAGAEFSHHLLGSFLGHKPPTAALRDGLLGIGST